MDTYQHVTTRTILADIIADCKDPASPNWGLRAVFLGGLILTCLHANLGLTVAGVALMIFSLSAIYIRVESERNQYCIDYALRNLDVQVDGTHIVGQHSQCVMHCIDGPLNSGPLKMLYLCLTPLNTWFEFRFSVIRGKIIEESVRIVPEGEISDWKKIHPEARFWSDVTLGLFHLPLLMLDVVADGCRLVGCEAKAVEWRVDRTKLGSDQQSIYHLCTTRDGIWFLYFYTMSSNTQLLTQNVCVLTEAQATKWLAADNQSSPTHLSQI